MGQAREQLAGVTGLLRNFERNGTLNQAYADRVWTIISSGQRARDIMEQLDDLVDANRGAIPRAALEAYDRVVGNTPAVQATAAPAAAPTRRVTISLDVSGGNGFANGRDINAAVEQALTAQAARAGLTVRPGSVAVTGV